MFGFGRRAATARELDALRAEVTMLRERTERLALDMVAVSKRLEIADDETRRTATALFARIEAMRTKG